MFSVFLLGDVVKDRLCFPVLYSFVFSKWTPMSSCFHKATRKRNSLRGVGIIGQLQDQFSCFARFHDYRAYDKHLLILENTALKFPKLNGLKFQNDSWTLETFTLGGSDFSAQIPLLLWKSFQSHPDCLRISLATLSVSEIENNSLSSCNFFFSKLPLLAEGCAGMWGQVLVQLQIKAAYSDPGEEQEGKADILVVA